MNKRFILILSVFFLMSTHVLHAVETNCIIINAQTEQELLSIGPSIDTQTSPCSTFKIALSLIGYDTNLLQDEETPLLSQKIDEENIMTASPRMWIQRCLVWYSKQLAQKIGKDSLQKYLSLFSYGNQDISGQEGKPNSFITAHLSSSLKISPREQLYFIKNFLDKTFPLSPHSYQMTKNIFPQKKLQAAWTVYGKTGSGFDPDETHKIAWYVGWIENNDSQYIFVLLMKDVAVFPSPEERQNVLVEYLQKAGIFRYPS